MTQFVTVPNIEQVVVLSVAIPYATSSNWQLASYKAALRHVNSHAFVNACMTAEVTASGSSVTLQSQPIIAYGGVGAHAMRASNTEAYLVGKNLSESSTLQGALSTLQAEMKPDAAPGRVQYRSDLVTNYFYRCDGYCPWRGCRCCVVVACGSRIVREKDGRKILQRLSKGGISRYFHRRPFRRLSSLRVSRTTVPLAPVRARTTRIPLNTP